MCRRSLAVVSSLLAVSCSAQSRLWRISPITGSNPTDPERVAIWPLAYVDSTSAAVLWPLMDFDAHGFAVRPIVAKDDEVVDVLFPLSHLDFGAGEGWALTGYSFDHNVGLFPLCNFGPEFNFVGPAFWGCEDDKLASWGLFPLAYGNVENGDGYILTAYEFGESKGLFPLFHVSPGFNFVGPAWWFPGDGKDGTFGLFPLFMCGDLNQYGPLWWTESDGRDDSSFGLFPLVWGDRGGDWLGVVPLYFQDLAPDHELRAALLPPMWWETVGDVEHHVVFPFYFHFAEAGAATTAFVPFFLETEKPGSEQWYSLIGNGWHTGDESGLNLYPLYWSEQSPQASRSLLVPFYLYREEGDLRELITPLGGRGWDASGATRFVNVLGPIYHKSIGADRETTSVLWPLYTREESSEGSDTWLAAWLGRYVAEADSDASSFRFWPLYGGSDAKETPDPLFDWSLFSHHSFGDEWSNHLFPLYSASGDANRNSFTTLAGLVHVGASPTGSSWRLWPLASASTDESADGWIDRATLFRHEQRGQASRDWLFPLYSASEDPSQSSWTALFGMARYGATAAGSAWRVWPLASGSTDEAADGFFDRITLFRHEQRGDASRSWLMPFYFGEHGPDVERDELLFSLARRVESSAGSAWRVWPLVSKTESVAESSPGLHDFVDYCTLVGFDRRPERSHFHAGTPLLFNFDREGEQLQSWEVHALALISGGHEERPPASDAPTCIERNHAGFLFDWFKVERKVVQEADGTKHGESHYRLPLLQEYESEPGRTEWDLLCYAVHSEATPTEETFSVLGYAYRSTTTATETHRDIFPAITYDRTPGTSRVSFLWRLFHYETRGEKSGGHLFFIPWGDLE